jgi:membrane-associated protease RseP (regulator of RpoE activity)
VRVEPRPAEEQDDQLATSPVRTALIVAATLFLGWRAGLSTILIIVALVFFIFLHELGHYLTARWAGMKVTEFFIGFGPRIWSFRRGETEYGIKAIPAGAYVRIIGMSNLETDIPPEDEPRTYRSKSYGRRLSVGIAGSTMHFLAALVLVFSVLSIFGVEDPGRSEWSVEEVSGPAAQAGVEPGDRIVAIDGEEVGPFTDVTKMVRSKPGESVDLVVDRDGEEVPITARLAGEHPQTGEAIGFLGVQAHFDKFRENPIKGAGDAVLQVRDAMWFSVTGLKNVFSPSGIDGYIDTVQGASDGDGNLENPNRFTSPVGTVRIAEAVAENGLSDLLMLLFVLNVFIGVFNLVPLLPLDGGHVAIATYEKIRELMQGGRPYRADVAKLMPVTYAVVLLLVIIGATALYVDIVDPLDFG